MTKRNKYVEICIQNIDLTLKRISVIQSSSVLSMMLILNLLYLQLIYFMIYQNPTRFALTLLHYTYIIIL